MNSNKNECFQSEENTSALNLSIEEISQKDSFSDPHQRQIHELIRKQLSRKSVNSQIPTVRKMISVLNSQHQIPIPQPPKNYQQEQTTSNSQLNSLYMSQSTKSNRNKKLKDISKLITLRKDVIGKIEKANQKYEQKSLKQSIQILIDDIYSARSGKAFFSQPHNMKSDRNDNKNVNTLKLLTKVKNNSNIESDVKYVSIPGSYKTIQSSRTSSQQVNQKKSLSRFQKDMSKLQAQKGYIKTIWQLGIGNKQSNSQKHNLYHTIDPNKTERWFQTARNSSKKLTQLFREKQSGEKRQGLTVKSKMNQYVQKLLEKSSQQYMNLTNEVKEITKARDKGKSLILVNRTGQDESLYKVKEKQYFRIQVDKSYIESKKSKQQLESINNILPQIKGMTRM